MELLVRFLSEERWFRSLPSWEMRLSRKASLGYGCSSFRRLSYA